MEKLFKDKVLLFLKMVTNMMAILKMACFKANKLILKMLKK